MSNKAYELNLQIVKSQFVSSVKNAMYEMAKQILINNSENGNMIRTFVDTIFTEDGTHAFQFACYLWYNDGRQFVSDYFDRQITSVLALEYVNIINVKYDDGCLVPGAQDDAGDMLVISYSGIITKGPAAWQFRQYLFYEGKYYYTIMNKDFSKNLKLGTAADDLGDHTAYCGRVDNGWWDLDRDTWWVEARKTSGGDIVFILHNRMYNLPLKLGVDVDDFGTHTAYGGESGSDTDRHSWSFLAT